MKRFRGLIATTFYFMFVASILGNFFFVIFIQYKRINGENLNIESGVYELLILMTSLLFGLMLFLNKKRFEQIRNIKR
uniref:Uncharacterized protein n=1 Tax=Aliivibrio wodanis TaxID=80852 RepID=A0A5Q4ZYM7_9GAMM|nr:hypothetical protein AW0309160_04467 [Aliivibrio wodanis]